jgi:hypothetical protein
VTLDSSLFTFAYDILEEGVDQVVRNAADRAGVNGLLMATTYHQGRDIFPHARRRRVRYLEPGVTFFRPDPGLYRGLAIQPRPASILADPAAPDPLAALVAGAGAAAMNVLAWTIFLHHDRPGEHIEFTPRNAFGDAIQTDLCPSNPAVREYSRALAEDVSSRGVSHVLAEAVHFFPLEHGVHHERYFVPLGPRTRFLLGLCFCVACLASARTAGVDGDRLRQWTSRRIEAAFAADVDDAPGDLDRSEVAAMADGELGEYLAVREATVASFVAELREVVRPRGVRLAVLEPSGAAKGYADGRPVGDASPSIAWRFGIDLPALGRAADEIEAVGYAADPGRIDLDLAAYRARIGDANLAMAVRPTAPDCDTVENLAAKMRSATASGVRRVDFYHYGLMRLDALDRIRAALDLVTQTAPGRESPGGARADDETP